MKLVRYCKRNKSLHIGGRKTDYKLSIFFGKPWAARLHLGKKTLHFGNW